MIFFTSLTSLPSLTSVQKSSLLLWCNPPRQIWCESSREFSRLRSFPIIYRLLAIICPISIVKKFTRLHQSSHDFDRLRNPSFPSVKPGGFNPQIPRPFQSRLMTLNSLGTSSRSRIFLKLSTHYFLRPTLSPIRRGPRRMMAAGAIRFQCFPNCQRSIVVVRFRFPKNQASRGCLSSDSSCVKSTS
jgi:hypothetical protein